MAVVIGRRGSAGEELGTRDVVTFGVLVGAFGWLAVREPPLQGPSRAA
jgi:hypothetical protein